MKNGLSNLIALMVLTVGSAIVMVTVGLGVGWGNMFFGATAAQKPAIEVPKTPVSVVWIKPQSIEIIGTYTGMMRPFERYVLGFEVAGRLQSLGKNADAKPLDEGDRVAAGQVLAQLDDRVLAAQLKESKAQLEQAQTDLARANDLRARNTKVITDAVYQDWVTKLQLAEARTEMAEKRLADAMLVSPVSGKLAKRMANVGESINTHQTIFEIIEIDRLLLVVGVPESRVADIRPTQQVHVDLLARDKFGQQLSALEGSVYRVSEAADDKTGLFEVEVIVDNPADRLRPGLVATARIVTSTVEGFRLPIASAVYRDGKTFLFSVGEDEKAHSVEIGRWIEQGGDIIIPELPEEQRTIVVRGQHRLIDGRAVEISELDPTNLDILQADLTLPDSPAESKR